MPHHLSRILLFVTLILLFAFATRARADETSSSTARVRLDDRELRERLDRLRDRLGSLRQFNPFAPQPRPGQPRILIRPPQNQEFFMRRIPTPPQDRSNWIRREFDGQTFYLVPCQQMQPLTSPTTRPSHG
jgi:hypothetical protein